VPLYPGLSPEAPREIVRESMRIVRQLRANAEARELEAT
jgi:hypothetical protein